IFGRDARSDRGAEFLEEFSFHRRNRRDENHALDAIGIKHRVIRRDRRAERMREQRHFLESEVFAQRFEIANVIIDREKLRVGWKSRSPSAALVVFDDAMIAPQRLEIIRERLVVHARTAVNHDDGRALPAVAVPEPDAVAGVNVRVGGEWCGYKKEEKQTAHEPSISHAPRRNAYAPTASAFFAFFAATSRVE